MRHRALDARVASWMQPDRKNMMADVKNFCECPIPPSQQPENLGMMQSMEPAASAADWGM
jgi:hypothetical protein